MTKRTEYVIYPSGESSFSLARAKKLAQNLSVDGTAFVERVKDQRRVATFQLLMTSAPSPASNRGPLTLTRSQSGVGIIPSVAKSTAMR